MKTDLRVIIYCSKDFHDYELLKEKCDYYLSSVLKDSNYNIVIVCGDDVLGEKYAEERGFPIETYPARWDQFGKKAGYTRDCVMANISDCLIAFLGVYSENKDVGMMIKVAENKNLFIRRVQEEE